MLNRRVTRGALWLDRELPGWEREIDTNILDGSSDRYCVLGQLFGDAGTWAGHRFFFDAHSNRRRGVLNPGLWVGTAWCMFNGFFILRSSPRQWNAAWETEIRKRLKPARPLYVSDILNEEIEVPVAQA